MKIIAHRGASGEFPENTLLAYEQAIIQGCHGIELDVQYHPEGELIIKHDTHLMINKKRLRFDQLSLHELLQQPLPQNQNIPTLKQALACINGRCLVNIEIKSAYLEPNAITLLVKQLSEVLTDAITNNHFNEASFIISSFNHRIIHQLKQLVPTLHTAALIASCPLQLAKFTDELAVKQINVALDSVNQSLVDDTHQRGLAIWVYTVNFADDLAFCKKLGVDAVFTDFPERSRYYLASIA